MVKCEVLKDTVLAIKKGSVVLVDESQYNLAKKVLSPLTEPKKAAEIEIAEMPEKETATIKKKSKKK
jgi:hypothetical protein